MKLKDIYNSGKLVISYEVFPPKGDDYSKKVQNLITELEMLKKYSPSYISVTYGAGGSTQDKSFDIVLKIKNELDLIPMPHFTCVGSSKDEIKEYLNLIQQHEIRNVLALRGDPPQGEEFFVKHEDGFGYANELVKFIKEQTDISIGVAGYPEKHQECSTLELDIENLKKKVNSGADAVITQIFYDNKVFFEFVDKAKKEGINVPIIPGILPITSLNQIDRMISLCGAAVPKCLTDELQEYKNEPEKVKEIGINYAIQQCKELIGFGIKGIHFYTLNKAYATSKILDELNIL